MNRIEPILAELNGKTMDQEDQMVIIMDALSDTVTPIPDVGTLCTFVYNAKTPNLRYDQHPLVAVTDLFAWGFRGTNFHHRETRQYTWGEIVGQVYIVKREELDDLLSVNYGKFITK